MQSLDRRRARGEFQSCGMCDVGSLVGSEVWEVTSQLFGGSKS